MDWEGQGQLASWVCGVHVCKPRVPVLRMFHGSRDYFRYVALNSAAETLKILCFSTSPVFTVKDLDSLGTCSHQVIPSSSTCSDELF